ncbi:lysophospholipid acyltransferase family protein [Leptospira idonii]|uniref:1-acyl-sn-glycerol-3-phosphate acyltransferase n=1 Tax=Leptospira idonii TaxID=1193500 RepID=A0A4R9M1W4_9LEPT|nr:1-acyl-sn-glycerol-3-phosphate acyltransferase [Leptospira idonii]TGN19835.1 1-acyl-sn-glycerol-3-phosphate acyltransferase [Leptospira idonii]
MKSSFIPPSFEFPVAWTLDLGFPIFSKLLFNLDGVEISREEERQLRDLRNKRVVYLSNHPSDAEPAIAYYVANQIGTRFSYMASRNIFNWGYGLVGEIIKRVGAFSVLSGGGDREAVKMAKNILSESDGKLVMYPEGMLSGENDNLVPFMPGLANLAFAGLEEALKKDPTADLFIQPSFVKYKISGNRDSILSEIESSLQRIEKKLKIYPGGRTLLRRFLTVGRVLLEETEYELGVPKIDIEGKDFDYRLGRARHTALNQAGAILNVKFHDTDHAIQKIRDLFTSLDSLEAGMPLPSTPKDLSPQNIKRARQLVDTAYTFLITKPKNLIQWPSAERLIEWIYSFEKHVFGKTEFRARKAHVLITPAFSITPFFRTYQSNKKEGISSLMVEIRRQMESLVEKGKGISEPIVPPYSVGLDINIG